MKNIHILPTDKPSLIAKGEVDNLLAYNKFNPFNSKHWSNQNIYITSDEEIKFNEYVIQVNFEKTNTQVIRCTTEFQVKIANDEDGSFTKKKIILTTDQDLIKDGVQAIDNEFLEWFVKNPRCEEVEVVEEFNPKNMVYGINTNPYKIIIPKEKPNKTHYLDELPNMDREVLAKMWESAMPKLEFKKETPEEAAERLAYEQKKIKDSPQ